MTGIGPQFDELRHPLLLDNTSLADLGENRLRGPEHLFKLVHPDLREELNAKAETLTRKASDTAEQPSTIG